MKKVISIILVAVVALAVGVSLGRQWPSKEKVLHLARVAEMEEGARWQKEMAQDIAFQHGAPRKYRVMVVSDYGSVREIYLKEITPGFESQERRVKLRTSDALSNFTAWSRVHTGQALFLDVRSDPSDGPYPHRDTYLFPRLTS